MTDLIGYGGGSEDQHVHYEASNSLISKQYARILDLISEGEILGLAKGQESIYLNGTPVQNPDGSTNFPGIAIDFRAGTQSQDYIPGFPSVENEIGVGVELRSTAPWTRAISNISLSAIRITLGVPALSKSDTSNGDILGYNIDYKIELATDGGAFTTVITDSFNGKTTSEYRRSVRIDLPHATTGWTVRVTRLTANANNAGTADTTTVVSCTEVIDAKLRYPMSAIAGLQVDAKQSQNVPTRAYDILGRIIQVPSNYDPMTRSYTGVWDGTFKPSWTNNPAWIFRDLVLNDRYGIGDRITSAQIDKWALYKIARYCDELVSNGKGGTEPRFTCNVYIQSQKQAYQVLQDMASIFRGITYWGGGQIMVGADMPADPIYVYTAANVVDGKFSRVGSAKKTRYTTALVSWNDPADMGKAKVEYCEDAEGIKRYGIQQVSLTAFGCTSQGQAQRMGRWALATSRLLTEVVTFEIGMDGMLCLPGQIVRIVDPNRMGRRNGGRIKAASGRVIVLDKAPTISAGDQLTAILPTGVSETHAVVSVAGDAVTINADWSMLPLAQSVWSVDNVDLFAPMYKVTGVIEKGPMAFAITAVQHEPGLYDYVENGIAITPRPQTSLQTTQAAPVAVAVSGYTVSLQDVQKLCLSAECAPVKGAVAYEGAFKRGDGNWFTLARQASPVFEVVDVLPDVYTVKLAAVNSVGVVSAQTSSAATAITKNANPKNAGIILTPSASGFNVGTGGTTPASITVHADLLDLVGTVSFSAVGGTITSSGNNATILATNMPGAAMTITAQITALGQTFTKSIDLVKNADGASGAPTYMWVKYGTSAAGAGLTDNPAGMSYIGLAFNQSTATESTNPADYAWSLIKGSNGSDGSSVYAARAYLQNASQPTAPTGGSFNFATSTLTPPTGWSATQPASSTTPTWVAQFTFSAATIGATVAGGTWSTPVNTAQNGSNGVSGNQYETAYLYQWNSTTPAAPNSTSTFNWVTNANTSYLGADNWSVTVPANPGTPGLRLFVVAKPISATAGTTSSPGISYSGLTVTAWSQNGANGAPGAQSGSATVYQWAATIPSGPTGSATYTWSTGLFGAAPTNWTLTQGTSPSPGYTLWAATVKLVDTTGAATSPITWTNAAITAQGYAGTNGTGTPGVDGLSYVTAYCASATASTTTTPASTSGINSVPAVNGGGIAGTWSKTVPTLTSGQFMYQSDGIYNPATGNVTWSIPYWSTLKVGSLSAISSNLGAITAGSVDIGTGTTSWHVDASGNQWAGASTYAAAPFKVRNNGDVGINNLSARGALMGGDFTGYSWPATGGTGYFLGAQGLMIGNGGDNKFVNISSDGNFYSPRLTMENGSATFSGALSAASGTFAGSLSAASGTFVGTLSAASGTFSGSLTASKIIINGNMADNSATTADIFGSFSSPQGFVMPRAGKVIISAQVLDGGGLNLYYEGFIGSPGAVADSDRATGSSGANVNCQISMSLPAGNYWIGPTAGSIIKAHVLKVLA